jgi:hypothetical protein
MLPSGMGWMSKIVPVFMTKFVNERMQPGQSLFLLPGDKDDLPEDMSRFFAANDVLSKAFAKMIGAFTQAATDLIPARSLSMFEKIIKKFANKTYVTGFSTEEKEEHARSTDGKIGDFLFTEEGFKVPSEEHIAKRLVILRDRERADEAAVPKRHKMTSAAQFEAGLVHIMLEVALVPAYITPNIKAAHVKRYGEELAMVCYCWATLVKTRLIFSQVSV